MPPVAPDTEAVPVPIVLTAGPGAAGRRLDQWLAEESTWDKAWVDAAGLSDAQLTLTPQGLRAMWDEIWEVVRRYRDNPPPEGGDATRVIWLQHLVPVRGELPL